MTLTIQLPSETFEQLQAEAQATGKDVETVVREAVDSQLARRKRTFAEILKPLRDSVRTSGLCESKVESLLEGELQDVRAQRRPAQARP